MTTEAIRLKNREQRSWRRFKTMKTRYDRDNYIQCKNDLRSFTRNLRKKFEQNLAMNLKGKPKTFWKYRRSRLKTRHSIPSLIKQDGLKATSAKEKAETMNDFSNVTYSMCKLFADDCKLYGTLSNREDNETQFELGNIVKKLTITIQCSQMQGHAFWSS